MVDLAESVLVLNRLLGVCPAALESPPSDRVAGRGSPGGRQGARMPRHPRPVIGPATEAAVPVGRAAERPGSANVVRFAVIQGIQVLAYYRK